MNRLLTILFLLLSLPTLAQLNRVNSSPQRPNYGTNEKTLYLSDSAGFPQLKLRAYTGPVYPVKIALPNVPGALDSINAHRTIFNTGVPKVAPRAIGSEQILRGVVNPTRTTFIRPAKQLFNKATITTGYYVSADLTNSTIGQILPEANSVATDFIAVPGSATITTSYLGNPDIRFLALYDSLQKPISTTIGGNRSSATIVVTPETRFIRGTVPITFVNGYQIEFGPTITPLSAYKEIGYFETPTGTLANTTARYIDKRFVVGKNLFNIMEAQGPDGIYPAHYVDSTGTLYANGSYTTTYYIPVKPNTTYTPSYQHYVACYTADKTPLSPSILRLRANAAFTTPENCEWVRLTVLTSQLNGFQLEEGGVATTPEAYSVLGKFETVTGTNALTLSQANATTLNSALSLIGPTTATTYTPFSVTAGGGGTASVSADGVLTGTPSGSFNTIISSQELDYIVLNPVSQWVCVGKMTDGSSVIVSINNNNIGVIGKISPAGALSFPGSSPPLSSTGIPTTSNRVKVAWNNSGDLIISYLNSTGAYVGWGAATSAQLATNGTAVTSRQMGVLNISPGPVFEYQVRNTSTPTLFNQRYDLAYNQEMYQRTYPLFNRTVALFGDSMTYEYGVPSGTYTDKVKAKTKARLVYKRGFSGCSLGAPTDGSASSLILTDQTTMDALINTYADAYVIWAGVNDFLHVAALGGDASQPENTTLNPTNTTIGGLSKLLNYVKANRPAQKILFCTPIPCPYLLGANSAGKTLKNYVDAIKQVCAYYSVPVLDLFLQSGFSQTVPAAQSLYFQADILHPSVTGYDEVSSLQARALTALFY